jgi:hydrogenase maturation factor HypE
MACIEHNRLMNRQELKLHGIEMDIEGMVERYQQKRRHNEVNQELRDLTTQIERIGKRFTSKATSLERPKNQLTTRTTEQENRAGSRGPERGWGRRHPSLMGFIDRTGSIGLSNE